MDRSRPRLRLVLLVPDESSQKKGCCAKSHKPPSDGPEILSIIFLACHPERSATTQRFNHCLSARSRRAPRIYPLPCRFKAFYPDAVSDRFVFPFFVFLRSLWLKVWGFLQSSSWIISPERWRIHIGTVFLAACPADAVMGVIISAVRRVAKLAQYVPSGRAGAR